MRVLVRSIDSSLVDEWENAGTQAQEAANLAAPNVANAVVEDRRGLIVLIRNAMFRRVQLMVSTGLMSWVHSTRHGITMCTRGRMCSMTSMTSTST